MSAPDAGERIDAATLGSYTFKLGASSGATVAAILDRLPGNLDDADDAAIWVAYLSSDAARKGVRLSQGNAVKGAKSLLDDPRPGRTLYFLAINFRNGVRHAASRAVPFSIGKPYIPLGQPCDTDNNTLCPNAAPLICVDGFCRAPCLSDVDCTQGVCATPGRNGIKSGVCL